MSATFPHLSKRPRITPTSSLSYTDERFTAPIAMTYLSAPKLYTVTR